MNKKNVLFSIVFCCIIFISSFSFATNMLDDAKNTMEDIKDGISNVTSDVTDTTTDKSEEKNTDNSTDDGLMITNTDNNSSSYSSSRTSSSTSGIMSNTAVVWIVMAIVGIVIVALVWYYGVQNTNSNDRSNR